jgi:ATP-dependent Clp protease ATP-binding subunit ClpA
LAGRIRSLGYELEVSDQVKAFLAEKGYDTVYGARPLKRLIQRMLENTLSIAILEGKYKPGDTIKVSLDEREQISLS